MVGLVSEYFVHDGYDVGDVENTIVVHVACLISECNYHLRVGGDSCRESVVLDIDGHQ